MIAEKWLCANLELLKQQNWVYRKSISIIRFQVQEKLDVNSSYLFGFYSVALRLPVISIYAIQTFVYTPIIG
jgi:hypothetical protein